MTSPNRWMDELYESEEGRRLLARERAWVDATETVCELMETMGVNRTELAKRLGTSQSNVTQLLSGRRNLTLKTLSDLFFVLGRRVRIEHGSLPDDRAEWQHAGDAGSRGAAEASATWPKASEPPRKTGSD